MLPKSCRKQGIAEQLRVFDQPGSITTNGARASHSLHLLALLWSNPAGLVRHVLGPRGIGWAHLTDLLARMRTANTPTTQQLGFKTPRLQRSCDARDAELSANRR